MNRLDSGASRVTALMIPNGCPGRLARVRMSLRRSTAARSPLLTSPIVRDTSAAASTARSPMLGWRVGSDVSITVNLYQFGPKPCASHGMLQIAGCGFCSRPPGRHDQAGTGSELGDLQGWTS